MIKKNTYLWNSRRACICIGVTTFMFMISWQFSQFILLLEVAALFAVYIFGFLKRNECLPLFKTFFLSIVSVYCVSLGNAMLITSMATILLLILLVIFSCEHLHVTDVWFESRITLGVVVVLVFAIIKTSVGFLLNDDGHIFNILKAKLFSFEDFMTLLYLCSPTYRAVDLTSIFSLSHLLIYAVAVSFPLVRMHYWYL